MASQKASPSLGEHLRILTLFIGPGIAQVSPHGHGKGISLPQLEPSCTSPLSRVFTVFDDVGGELTAKRAG